MGCCLTTAATNAAGDDRHQHVDSKLRCNPPPPAEEEETVKEVLSETPIISKTPTKTTVEEITSGNGVVPCTKKFTSGNGVVPFTNNPIEEVASEGSYTYSETFSAATTTTTTSFATDLKRSETAIDEDGEVTQKLKKRSPAKTLPRKQPPPTTSRRSAIPSMDKKIQLRSRNITTAQRHRSAVPSNVVRREPPAKSPARKFKERSPVRKSGNVVPVSVTEDKRKLKLKRTIDAGVLPEPEPEICESLENPLVSLECFIFL